MSKRMEASWCWKARSRVGAARRSHAGGRGIKSRCKEGGGVPATKIKIKGKTMIH
jgi:hypothetical protein